jgi:hypothetical protein
VTRDGKVNPDVRTLPGPGALNDVSQAILYNTLAYVFTRSSSYAQDAVTFLTTFFLSSSTRMNPNMNFGQIVRGPGPQGVTGSWTGILDMRGNLKIINAIDILVEGRVSGWTPTLHSAMIRWYGEYLRWMTTSNIGKKAKSRPK